MTQIRINSLPSGGAIADIEYRADEGQAISLNVAVPGDYPISADAGASIQIRGVSAAGAPGEWSLAKVVPGEIVPGIPDNAITLNGTAETALSLDGTVEAIIILAEGNEAVVEGDDGITFMLEVV